MVTGVDGTVPDPQKHERTRNSDKPPNEPSSTWRCRPECRSRDIKIDKVFIGSCTNARIEDLRLAASFAKGKKVADSVHAMVVPGSGLVKQQAEQEGLDRIFKESGFEWRDAGCSMCLAMNADVLSRGTLRVNQQSEFRRTPGSRRTDSLGVSSDGRGGCYRRTFRGYPSLGHDPRYSRRFLTDSRHRSHTKLKRMN